MLEDSPVLTTDRDLRSEYWANEKLRSYGRTKLQGELAISEVAQNVEYAIRRPTAVIDIQDLMRLRGWNKIKKAVKSTEHPHHICVRDVDVVSWFMEHGLERDQPLAEVTTFNLSDGDTSIKTLVRSLALLMRLAATSTGVLPLLSRGQFSRLWRWPSSER